ncbi:MAG TPA: N-acetylmuramoyl-L-alanine amidase, partial [Thermomicrobiales bacterium]|nr:N-acetylmuramoyl-L-alanine amidase [Thermomicrobiales bacterium]
MNQQQPEDGCDVVQPGPDTAQERGASSGSRSRLFRPVNRRVVMKASAAVSAITMAGGIGAATGLPARTVRAAQNGGTRAGSFVPDDQGSKFSAASEGDFVTFQTDFPFYALGANWGPEVGSWPVIEVQISTDGATWSDTYEMAENHEDGGRPTRGNRFFTPLIFTDGEQYVRYRTVDSNGNAGTVTGLSFTYIDATDGPWAADVDAAVASPDATTFAAADTGDDRVPPTVVTREEWGADESWRYDSSIGQIWPPEYQTVEHVIVHHTDTPTTQDPIVAIRSIYYYHAVDQGWGDIGYNYLVDRNGRIYEGRYGGQNVIGGHSYEYANGSSGISIIGDYQDSPPSDVSVAGLVAIASWVARKLDPYGTSDFLEAPDLPTICAHRDVNSTTCPGDQLYFDIAEIRSLVAATLNAGDLDSGHPGGIAVRDRIVIQTDDGGPLNLRSNAGTQYSVVAQLANGSPGTVTDGPVSTSSDNWYKILSNGTSGWVVARYLIVSPSAPPASGKFVFGQNIQFTTTTNV